MWLQNKISPILIGRIKDSCWRQCKGSLAKGSNVDYDLEFEKNVTMFGKAIPRDGRTDKQLLDEAVAIAKQSDVVIAAIGETAEMSGESSSRTNLEIPQAQKELFKCTFKNWEAGSSSIIHR